jgi:tRNA(Ile)-lysidine synthetase-like protein
MTNISGRIRRAIEDYNMIEDGDKIAVALSGGKDSISLLYELKTLQRFYKNHFDLIALSIDPGFEGFDTNVLKVHCNKLEIPLVIYEGNIKQIVFDERKEQNPCSLCANLRRGMLNTVAKENGCNKVALGHNEDDVLETFLMNMTYAGRIDTFAPVSYMDRTEMTIIRPLIYVREKDTKAYVKKNNLEIIKKVCPADGSTTRQYALDLLKELEIKNKQARANLMGAIKRAKINGWKES